MRDIYVPDGHPTIITNPAPNTVYVGFVPFMRYYKK